MPLMVVRTPQLGEAISTVASRKKSFHLAAPDARHTRFLPWLS
jgi:hypothetical protein